MNRVSLRHTLVLGVICLLMVACGGGSPKVDWNSAGEPIQILVVSNRADLVSGGDVLVEIRVSDDALPTVWLNNQLIDTKLTKTAVGTYLTIVEGLKVGSNVIEVRSSNSSGRVEITNAPISGPIFSGPQIQPWVCQSPIAEDEDCNQPASYSYFYKSTNPVQAGLIPFDPDNPPSDVANTTTANGLTLPFIVRLEQGYINRDLYNVAVLFQLDKPWTAALPQEQYNRKLLVNHGFGCAVEYQTSTELAVNVVPGTETTIPIVGGKLPVGIPLPVLSDATETALAAGFAVMGHALNNSKHNCNLALQAESIVMTKEHVIERYGKLRYTIGQGCSGGSLAVQWIANAYPGIYQGILPCASFPDAWSTATQFADNHLTLAYFLDPSKWGLGVVWTPTQMTDVQGHISLTNAIVGDNALFSSAVATNPCGGTTDENRYHPETNPTGVRCTIMDAVVNLIGPRPPEMWSEAELLAGKGFGGFPVDNVGVQYGLKALQRGLILPNQFLDLNLKIGGFDIDANLINERFRADPIHLANVYKTGLINVTNNLNQTAIIDCRGPDPGVFHDAYRAYAVRARLDREHGNHDNQLIWEGPVLAQGDNFCVWRQLSWPVGDNYDGRLGGFSFHC